MAMALTPIKRTKNLVPLSKDHHEGLLVVWKVRQGLHYKIEPDRINNFIGYAFDKHLQPHFIEEEEFLFNRLPDSDPYLVKAKEQHASLRKMVDALRSSSGVTYSRLASFAGLLEEHIRFEERELFGHLEGTVSPAILEAIGSRLQEIHSMKKPLYWEDQFWLRK
jgi:hemerythrin-like domain-containing protein